MAIRWFAVFVGYVLSLVSAYQMQLAADDNGAVVNYSGAFPDQSVYATYPKCGVSIRAYSASETKVTTDGYVKLNGVTVWEAGWYSTKPNLRGVSLFTIDPITCTVLISSQTFDTCGNDAAAGKLNAFLDGVPNGNIIVGVTGDEPQSRILGSVTKLSSYGVNVADIKYRSNFAFVAQKGSPAKTQFTKQLTNSPPFSSNLNVNVQGGRSAADVKIDLISKTP
jgi:hypothetical protein